MRRPISLVAVLLLLGVAGRGWCRDEPATASPAAAPVSFESLVRQNVKDLGYPDSVSDDLLRMVRHWGCLSWKQRLDRVRREYQQQEASATVMARTEEDVAKLLFQTMRGEITQVSADKSDYFYLSKVVSDKKAQCLGTCQLLYVVGSAVGLQVKTLDVLAVNVGHLPVGVGHAASLISLSGGRVLMMDVRQGYMSRPFVLEEEFSQVGDYYELRKKANPLALHPRIRVIDTSALVGMIYYNLATRYAEAHQYDQVLLLADKAVQLDPRCAKCYVKRAGARCVLKQYAEALSDCNKAIELDPTASEAYDARGDVYQDLGQYAEAIADHTKAIELNPENYRAYAGRGNTCVRMGRFADALADLSKSIELDPKSADAFNDRGLAHAGLGQYAEAVSDYAKAIELDPKCGRIYHNRAMAYALLGKMGEAKKDLQTAAALDPSLKEPVQRVSEQFKLGL